MKLASTPEAEGPPEEAVKVVGCAHYKRKSKFVVSQTANKSWKTLFGTMLFVKKYF